MGASFASEVENVLSSAMTDGQRAKPSVEKRVAGKSSKDQTSKSFLIGGWKYNFFRNGGRPKHKIVRGDDRNGTSEEKPVGTIVKRQPQRRSRKR